MGRTHVSWGEYIHQNKYLNNKSPYPSPTVI